MSAGFLQRGEVRHAAQTQDLSERRMIDQVSHDAAVVGLQEVLQHQAGKQLMLRKLLGTVRMRVQRQHLPRCRQRRTNNRIRRITGNSHIVITHPIELAA